MQLRMFEEKTKKIVEKKIDRQKKRKLDTGMNDNDQSVTNDVLSDLLMASFNHLAIAVFASQ